ncbi:MAG TPA: helicase HerA-like domain-containing protein [Gaiellaceae bacterium]|nr:helicase HerA-like domain-containing protein [Gaiellaceae bacterium]
MSLHIAEGLDLPDDFAGLRSAIVARAGGGKTYTASVLAEEMVNAAQPWYALDPTGAWWGLRAGADGRSPGLPVVVLGGEHGDVPLPADAGAAVADLVAHEPSFYVIDMSDLGTRGAEVRFATAFFERLYRTKGKRRDPLHGFWDEADLFAPQRCGPAEARMLGAAEQVVRRGRIRGLGVSLISQRPAVVNKNVLSQIDVLIALVIGDERDRRAIKGWLDGTPDAEHRREVLESLAGLDRGEAWIYAPAERPAIYCRARIRERRTFNSSARGARGRSDPAQLADVNLDALRERMAASIQRAQAEDPRALRARIAQLERELHSRPTARAAPVERRVEVIPADLLDVVTGIAHRLSSTATSLSITGTALEDEAIALRADEERLHAALARVPQPVRDIPTPPAPRPPAPPAPPRRLPVPDLPDELVDVLTGPRQAILDAIAALERIGAAPAPKIQVALLAGVSHKSSGYQNNCGALRTAGLVDYPAGGMIALTDQGRDVADGGAAPATPEAMWTFVEQLVGAAKWNLLRTLIENYPNAVTKADLAQLSGVSASSSGFQNNCGALRSLRLLDYPSSGMVIASPILFLETAP